VIENPHDLSRLVRHYSNLVRDYLRIDTCAVLLSRLAKPPARDTPSAAHRVVMKRRPTTTTTHYVTGDPGTTWRIYLADGTT